jgi:hypothetical protein
MRALAAKDPDLAHYMEQSTRLAEKLIESRKLSSAATN